MTPTELRAYCHQQINIVPGMEATATIGLRMRGHRGKRGTKRIWPGGPVGEIVSEISESEVIVFFDAHEVLAALDKHEFKAQGKEARDAR
jgi:hypothetical protein